MTAALVPSLRGEEGGCAVAAAAAACDWLPGRLLLWPLPLSCGTAEGAGELSRRTRRRSRRDSLPVEAGWAVESGATRPPLLLTLRMPSWVTWGPQEERQGVSCWGSGRGPFFSFNIKSEEKPNHGM